MRRGFKDRGEKGEREKVSSSIFRCEIRRYHAKTKEKKSQFDRARLPLPPSPSFSANAVPPPDDDFSSFSSSKDSGRSE